MSLVHTAFHRPGTRAYRWTQGTVWTLIVVSLAVLALELALPPEHPLHPRLVALDQVILLLFAIELVLRVASYRPPAVDFFRHSAAGRLWTHLRGRLFFCLRPLMLVDILTVAALVPGLRGLRAVRLLRLLRTSRILRYSQPFEGLARAFRENGLLFGFALSLLGTAVLLGGLSLYLVERGMNPEMNDLGDGLWWALVTITTVGFGDISPVTTVGRLVGAVMMVLGMFTIALFAGIVGATLLRAVLTLREEQFRMSTFIDHVVLLGYEEDARTLLDTIQREVDPERHPVVLFAESERPADLPPRFGWVIGDPTRESELGKLRLAHAASAVIVGSRRVSPQQADARTLLTAFTLRSYLARQPAARRRREPLRVVAEILDSENVEHARVAGADEVVETTRVGFSLLAHALAIPGTADVVSQVAAAGAQSVWVGRLPEDVPAGPFGDVARELKRHHGVLLLGVRPAGPPGEDEAAESAPREPGRRGELGRHDSGWLNPPDTLPISAADHLLYLAEQPLLPAI